MADQEVDAKMGLGGYAMTGAGVGAAGAGSVVTLMGLSTGLLVLPFSLAVGVVGGLAWWGLKSLTNGPSEK